jgi:membrane protein DedA with SNARE-associated domain
MNLGQAIYDLFGANGEWGLVLCIFLIFLLDALLIPTLPELFFVLAFIGGANYGHPLLFGVELLIAAVIAEQIGIFSLYLVVKKYNHKIPKKIQSALDKYTQFLVVSDEKLLLLNRVAPMLPFAGAFVAILNWSVPKSAFYIAIGCVVKFGFIMMLSNFFYNYFQSEESQIITIVMILAVIAVSIVLSFFVKKKKGIE